METISVSLQKGGTGKTTIAVNLAAILANMLKKSGQRVLLVDADPQATATQYLWDEEESPPVARTMTRLFNTKDEWDVVFEDKSLLFQSSVENLWVAPSSIHLSVAEAGNFQEPGSRIRTWLKHSAQDFSIIIIDCPPNLGRLTTNSLLATDHVIIPCTPEPAAMEAMKIFSSTLQQIARVNQSLDFMGVIINDLDERTNVHKHYRDAISAMFTSKLLGKIHRSTLLPEIQHQRKTVLRIDKSSRTYNEFRSIALEVLNILGMKE